MSLIHLLKFHLSSCDGASQMTVGNTSKPSSKTSLLYDKTSHKSSRQSSVWAPLWGQTHLSAVTLTFNRTCATNEADWAAFVEQVDASYQHQLITSRFSFFFGASFERERFTSRLYLCKSANCLQKPRGRRDLPWPSGYDCAASISVPLVLRGIDPCVQRFGDGWQYCLWAWPSRLEEPIKEENRKTKTRFLFSTFRYLFFWSLSELDLLPSIDNSSKITTLTQSGNNSAHPVESSGVQ